MSEPLTREPYTIDELRGIVRRRGRDAHLATQLLAAMDALDTLRRELADERERGARLAEAGTPDDRDCDCNWQHAESGSAMGHESHCEIYEAACRRMRAALDATGEAT